MLSPRREREISLPIYIYGAGGHGKAVSEVIKSKDKYEIKGFIDDNESINKANNLPVLTLEDFSPSDSFNVVIAVGNNQSRRKIYKRLRNKFRNINFPSIIHKHSFLSSDVEVGEGAVIMAGVNVGPDTKVEAFSILNSSSSIDHDCKIGEFSFIGPGAILGGGVVIREEAFIGLGSKIINNISIGERSIVGAGSLVLKDIEDDSLNYGSPSQFIKKV